MGNPVITMAVMRIVEAERTTPLWRWCRGMFSNIRASATARSKISELSDSWNATWSLYNTCISQSTRELCKHLWVWTKSCSSMFYQDSSSTDERRSSRSCYYPMKWATSPVVHSNHWWLSPRATFKGLQIIRGPLSIANESVRDSPLSCYGLFSGVAELKHQTPEHAVISRYVDFTNQHRNVYGTFHSWRIFCFHSEIGFSYSCIEAWPAPRELRQTVAGQGIRN